jgi:hypothetical protein
MEFLDSTQYLRQIRTKVRSDFGTHGLYAFSQDVSNEDTNNRELARKWKLTLWQIQQVKARFPVFFRLVFPQVKVKCQVLTFKQSA